MTLTKTKPKRPTTEHRKRVGHHHRHSNHYLKTYWPYLPVVGILSLGFVVNAWLGNFNRGVLGYATDMSIQSLLDDTNVQRTQNSDATLTLNAELNHAAQAKADDMAARDYWSHTTPDGQEPWTFVTASGYTYVTAGENLAYGFTTAADTITGWMNSPEHRANILNVSYRDIGFGIVNIQNYQGTGPETLVVAMYGSTASAPTAVAAAPVPRPVQSKPAPAPASQQPTPVQSAPAPSPITTTTPATSTPSAPAAHSDTLEPKQQRVTQLQLVASNMPMSSAAIVILGFSAFAFLVLRHSFAWRKVLVHGESFVLHHPLLDIAAVSVASVVIVLSHTAGLIR